MSAGGGGRRHRQPQPIHRRPPYAGALGNTEARQKLKGLFKETYNGDEDVCRLSETMNADAQAEDA